MPQQISKAYTLNHNATLAEKVAVGIYFAAGYLNIHSLGNRQKEARKDGENKDDR